MERVRVVLRVRPNVDGSDDEDIVDIRGQRKVIISKPGKKNTYLLSQQTRYYEYTFDHIFPPNADQETVYNISTCNFLKNAISNGINLTVFVYGATGTGKTYTIIGNEKNPGIVIRGINETFEYLFSDERFVKDNNSDMSCSENNSSNELKPNSNFFVTASYMEIYNETIRDLLNPSNSSSNGQYSCEILEDQSNIQISNLTQLLIENSKDGIQALNFGNKYRKIEQTVANNVSSRSHAIFQLSIFLERKKLFNKSANNNPHKFIRSNNYRNDHFPSEKLYKPSINNSANPQLWCKISFIDLAGSERASATQNRGIRLTEGAHINRSLLALANCINSLALSSSNIDGQSIINQSNDSRYHVKYRDSKLTHILKNSLEGEKCFVVMIANISPSSKAFEESHNTLKYANRAKNIKVKISNHLLNENEENDMLCTCNCNIGIDSFDKKAKSKKKPLIESSSQTIISGLVTVEKKIFQDENNYGLNLINQINNSIYDVINSLSEFSNQISNKKVNKTIIENNSFSEKENNSLFQQNEINYSDKQLNRASFVSTQSNDEVNSLEISKVGESLCIIELFKELESKIFSIMTDSLNKLKEIKLEYNEILNSEALLLKKIQKLAEDFSIKRQKKYAESLINE
ncbi:Kinesin motor domain containing protein [Cryptosporidium meleagridis]